MLMVFAGLIPFAMIGTPIILSYVDHKLDERTKEKAIEQKTEKIIVGFFEMDINEIAGTGLIIPEATPADDNIIIPKAETTYRWCCKVSHCIFDGRITQSIYYYEDTAEELIEKIAWMIDKNSVKEFYNYNEIRDMTITRYYDDELDGYIFKTNTSTIYHFYQDKEGKSFTKSGQKIATKTEYH